MKPTTICLWACAMLLAGCDKPTRPDAPSPRIVTFAPHITDIAFDMGLGDHVVGVTTHCLLPPGQTRPVVGDVFKVNAEAILAVEPDVLFYNQKDSDFDALRQVAPSLKLIRLRNGTLAELRASIVAMGAATDRPDLAAGLLDRIDRELDAVGRAVAGRARPAVLFVLGTDSAQTIGADWITHELLRLAGGENAAAAAGLNSWAKINRETVLAVQPDVLICDVSMSGETTDRAGTYWRGLPGLKAAATGRVYVVNDRRLTIPGSRIGQTARKLAAMIHPDAFADPEAGRP